MLLTNKTPLQSSLATYEARVKRREALSKQLHRIDRIVIDLLTIRPNLLLSNIVTSHCSVQFPSCTIHLV
jgi:hypothetical protein